MKLVVGLGNPGRAYEGTRHNVGFDVVDRLGRRYAPGVVARSRFSGVLLEGEVDGERALLLKPTTFMNLSGQAVSEAVHFYKLDPGEALLVVVDDVALPCGTIRVRGEGSAGGHNGLADVERRLGTSVYARLRIGIDAPGSIPQKDYVTGRFRPDQLEAIAPALEDAALAAAHWVREGVRSTMNQFNRRPAAGVPEKADES